MDNIEFEQADELLDTLVKGIKFSERRNSRNGRVITTIQASVTPEMYEQHLRTLGSKTSFGITSTRAGRQLRAWETDTDKHTPSELASLLHKQLPERALLASVSRVLKRLPRTATASEFYERVTSDFGERPSKQDLRAALRAYIREQR